MLIHKANDDIKIYEHLVDKDDQQVTHLHFKAGGDLGTHSSPWKVIVVIYKGRVEFTGENGMEEIVPGMIVEMEPGEEHSLKALEDSDLMVIKSKLA